MLGVSFHLRWSQFSSKNYLLLAFDGTNLWLWPALESKLWRIHDQISLPPLTALYNEKTTTLSIIKHYSCILEATITFSMQCFPLYISFKVAQNYLNQWPFMHISVWHLECELRNTSWPQPHLLCKCEMWKSVITTLLKKKKTRSQITASLFCVRVNAANYLLTAPMQSAECSNQCMYVGCHGFLVLMRALSCDLHLRVGFVVMWGHCNRRKVIVVRVHKRSRNSFRLSGVVQIWMFQWCLCNLFLLTESTLTSQLIISKKASQHMLRV